MLGLLGQRRTRYDPARAGAAVIPLSAPRRAASLLFAVGAVSALYATVGVHMAREGTAVGERVAFRQVPTPLDDWVPFQPAWVVIYAMVYLQAVAPASTITDRRVMDRTVAAFLTLALVAVPFWIWFPVTVPRHPTPITDVWTYGIGLVRLIDPPTNCMPSMHVGTSAMAALVVWRHDRPSGLLLALSAAAIWWSTMAIDQHWALDGLVAVGLAVVVDRLWFDLRPLPRDAFTPLHRAWHLAWVGGYLALVAVLMSGWWLGWVPVDQLPPNAPSW